MMYIQYIYIYYIYIYIYIYIYYHNQFKKLTITRMHINQFKYFQLDQEHEYNPCIYNFISQKKKMKN